MIFLAGGFTSFVIAVAASRILMPFESMVVGALRAVPASLATAFLTAAFPEELARIMVSFCSIAAMRNLAGRNVVVTCGMISVGFAMFENMLYSVTTTAGVEIIVERTVPTLSHWATGLIMGSFLERAVLSGRPVRIRLYLLTFAVPCLLHGLYDFGAFVLEASEFPDLPDEPTITDLKPLGAILAPILLLFSVGMVELIWGGRIMFGLRKKSANR